MYQYEAVIQVMEENGGYATLGHLYENALKVSDVDWKTKTPFASIRRIVQDERHFFKIRPGLWALKSHKDSLPFDTQSIDKDDPQSEFSHSYFQGLLVEIGNLQDFETHVPPQDRNKFFLSKQLKQVTRLDNIYDFSYSNLVEIAKNVDVTWFNENKMPHTFIEVEHTTGIFNSLIKFVELKDFFAHFWIAASEHRNDEFNDKIARGAFEKIKGRVDFVGYEKISELHSNLYKRKIEIGL